MLHGYLMGKGTGIPKNTHGLPVKSALGECKDDLIEDPWNYDAEYEDGILAIDNMYGPVYD